MDMITLAMAKAYADKKGGYIETSQTDIIPQTTTEGAFVSGSCYCLAFYDSDLHLNAGETYVVEWDGVRYVRTCFKNYSINVLGSMGVASPNKEDTGEPFCLVEYVDNVSVFFKEGVHTFRVYQETETVHPIDPKYIPWDSAPGGGLPVVELDIELSEIPNDLTLLTGENSARLEAIADKTMPFMLILRDGMYRVTAVMTHIMNSETANWYLAISYAGKGFQIGHLVSDKKWYIRYDELAKLE